MNENTTLRHVGMSVRVALTVGLIYKCSTETGPWTALALVLIFLFVEVQTTWRQ